MAGVHHREFRIAPARQERHDLVALPPAGGALADCGHLAGDLEAEGVGGAGRGRIEPQTLQNVGPIHAGGPDANQHLTRSRFRRRPLNG